MADCLEMYSIGSCRRTTGHLGAVKSVLVSPGDPEVRMSRTVGFRGVNEATDVINIQYALNRVPVADGGPVAVEVDGACGNLTIDAIRKFQLKHFGWSGMDGLVEPERQTHLKLKEYSAAAAANPVPTESGGLDPVRDKDLVDEVRSCIPEVKACIAAARANLLSAGAVIDDVAGPSGGLQIFSRSERMLLVNKHFDLDGIPDKNEKRRQFEFIDRTYHYMQSMLTRPGGLWGVHAFQPAMVGFGSYFYTQAGGFHTPGALQNTSIPHDQYPRLRRDAIYICRRLREEPKRREAIIHGLIHEMGHFCGPVTGEIIDDHFVGPAWFPGGEKATPAEKVHCAESYAYFAREAKYGRNMHVFPFGQ